MSSRIVLLAIVNLFCACTIFGGDLNKQEQEKLRKSFAKGQQFFLIHQYLEGDVKGLHIYKIRADADPEFVLRGATL